MSRNFTSKGSRSKKGKSKAKAEEVIKTSALRQESSRTLQRAVESPKTASPKTIQTLQHHYGNRAVAQLLKNIIPTLIQRGENDDEDLAGGARALADALQSLSNGLGTSTVDTLAEMAERLKPTTLCLPAVQAWENLVQAIRDLITEQQGLDPIPVPDETLETLMERNRLKARSERKRKRTRKALKTAKFFKHIPGLNTLTKSDFNKISAKSRQAGLDLNQITGSTTSVMREYDNQIKEEIKDSEGGQAFLAAQADIRRIMKAGKGDTKDLDTLDIIFSMLGVLRTDPRYLEVMA
jgi:hypothetical protein